MTDLEKPPLKVLLITHYYPMHRGGIEIVAGKLAESLSKIGNIEINWMASNVDPHPIDIPRLQCLPITLESSSMGRCYSSP